MPRITSLQTAPPGTARPVGGLAYAVIRAERTRFEQLISSEWDKNLSLLLDSILEAEQSLVEGIGCR